MGHYFLVLENRSDLDARILSFSLSLSPFRVGGERHRAALQKKGKKYSVSLNVIIVNSKFVIYLEKFKIKILFFSIIDALENMFNRIIIPLSPFIRSKR